VDVSVPLERQKEVFTLIRGVIRRDYTFADKGEAHSFFTTLTGLFKNLNYTRRAGIRLVPGANRRTREDAWPHQRSDASAPAVIAPTIA